MYRYDDFDRTYVRTRVAEFRDQVERRIAGSLTEDEFRPLRLMMHGAPAETPVTAVENASRPEQRVIATTLFELPQALAAAAPAGPVMILYGLAPRAAAMALSEMKEAL
jgi:hypothetical protein